MAPPNKPASGDRRNQPSSSKEPETEGPMKQLSGGRRPRAPSKELEEGDATPSNTLWVGNLSIDTTESDLTALFAKYGDVDSVTTYPARNYAFLYFKNLEDAKTAREALQGSLVRGNSLKIEFAKPAKPGKLLWIGGINAKVTKKELEDAFSKFGKIEEFKLHRDRSSALVDYYKVEDAIDALKNMNGKNFGGEKIRVDFLRSQPQRRGWGEHHDFREMHFNKRNTGFADSAWLSPEATRFFPESSQNGQRRHPYGGQKGQQSKVLWVRYPPSAPVNEQMLHNAMILFGEIENIKAFQNRHYAFVEFRSIDEARRAKEGLQGRLFGDPRIEIMFSNSEFTAAKDDVDFFWPSGGFGPDMFPNDHPPFGQPEFDGPRRSMGINEYPGPFFPNGVPGPNMLIRPFSPHGVDSMHNYGDSAYYEHPSPNWTRLSPPMAGPLRPSPGFRPPSRISQGGSWDGLDPRDRKRLRLESPSVHDDRTHQTRMMGMQGVTDAYRFSQSSVAQDPDLGRSAKGISHGAGVNDYCWRGIIAKGGTPVCQARCIPIGRGIESSLPEIVNCSARTGLDMLTKHYAEASGFDIVFFLPDSEEDFASYTEFLQYLSLKDRAGVAKLDDGTTMFLVPPSDFLNKVLNVSGPDRLYGVVLKLPQLSSTAAMQQPLPSSRVMQHAVANAPMMQSSINSNGYLPESHPPMFGHNGTFAEDSIHSAIPEKPLVPVTHGSQATSAVPPGPAKHPTGNTVVGSSLTPDLIATLAFLMPGSNHTPVAENSQVHVPLNPSTVSTPFLPPEMYDKGRASQEWNPSNQSVSLIQQQGQVHAPHQLGMQYSDQASISSQVPNYSTVANASDVPFEPILERTVIRDQSINSRHNMPNHTVNNNYVIPSQTTNFPVPSSNTHNLVDTGLSYQMNHGMSRATDGTGVYNFVLQQAQASTHNQVAMQADPQMTVASIANIAGAEFANQLHQLQTALPSSSQETPISEADKNQRYQSTLEFAATLLQQIRHQQQQQQQTSTQTVQGSKGQQ